LVTRRDVDAAASDHRASAPLQIAISFVNARARQWSHPPGASAGLDRGAALEFLSVSIAADPFAADKQVLRRARAAFADIPGRVLHFLHPNAHSFQVGLGGLDRTLPDGVTAPILVEPESRWSVAWQADDRTRQVSPSLFELIEDLSR
jgi:hypothetical protein